MGSMAESEMYVKFKTKACEQLGAMSFELAAEVIKLREHIEKAETLLNEYVLSGARIVNSRTPEDINRHQNARGMAYAQLLDLMGIDPFGRLLTAMAKAGEQA